MSLTATQTLDDASGDAVTYSLIGEDKTGSIRMDSATTLTEPRKLEIKHSSSGKGADVVDRHLVQASHLKVAGTGQTRTAVVNLTLAVPRDSVITATIVQDLLAAIIDLITDGGFGDSGFVGVTNLSAIMRGES
jgi:hypothetical protein